MAGDPAALRRLAGTALRRRPETSRWAIGTSALAASVLAFVLLLAAIWLQAACR